MKKLLALLTSLSLLFALAACGGGTSSSAPQSTPEAGGEASTPADDANANAAESDLNVVLLITTTLGTQAFADVIDAGCKQAAADFNFQYSVVESLEAATVSDAVRAVVSQGANFIVAGMSNFDEAIPELAEEFPAVQFVSLDSGGSITEVADNLHVVTYKEHEAAFLNGVFVAMMSETGKVAQLQGGDGGTMVRFNAGFRAGVQYAGLDDPTTVVVGYADVNKAYETANMLFDQGYDWIANCAAGSNLGAFQAVEEKGGDNYVTAAADGQFHLMPSRIVASQVKTIHKVVYNLLADTIGGSFPGGTSAVYGIAEGGVDLIFTTENDELLALVPQNVYDALDALRTDIASGKLVVPENEDELAAFEDRM